jgi:hypothetical protein
MQMFKKIEIGVWVFLIFSFLVILVGNAGLSGKTDIIHETNGTIERLQIKDGKFLRIAVEGDHLEGHLVQGKYWSGGIYTKSFTTKIE